jgi:hypothetical protein
MKSLAFLTLIACLPLQAAAADCPQAKALYQDADKAYGLQFKPVNSTASPLSHLFDVTVGKTAIVMQGHVMTTDEVSRTIGTLQYQCPDGDVTGEDIAACTVWEGLIFAISDKGDVAILPAETAKAADKILLPDFGPSLRVSKIWGAKMAHVAPFDVLTFAGCAS